MAAHRVKPLQPCGTPAAFRRHRNKGEPPCARCAVVKSGRATLVPVHGTARRLAALLSIGWTYKALADELGVGSAQIGRWIRSEKKIQPRNAENVLRLFGRLQMRIVPSDLEHKALREAHPPPLAWDEGALDNPNAKPAEWRRPERSTNRAEDIARDAAELMGSFGESPEGAAQRLGITVGSMQTAIRRAAVRAERSA